MGMISNAANAAAADAVAKQQEMQMLLRGKTSEQQAVIKFFYGASGGCMHAGGMTVEEYQKKVQAKRDALNTKAMALRKLGIEEEEVKEIAPVTFEGYIFNDKVDNLVARATANTWVSSEYMITWLFFGEREVFIYRALTEVIAVALHRQAINANHNIFFFALIPAIICFVSASNFKHTISNEFFTSSIALDNCFNQIFRHISIIS